MVVTTAWEMPKWMEPYRDLVEQHTTGGTVEEWMNDDTSVFINGPRALIACNVKGHVRMLYLLHDAGALGEREATA